MERRSGRWGWLALAVLVLGAAGAVLGFRWGGAGADLPVYWTLPDFALVERSGERVTLGDLKGKVWVADFIYTRCEDTCPVQSAEMARLQEDLKDLPGLVLVSITIDPERDTTGALAAYADRFGARADRWWFLTGSRPEVHALVRNGFRLSVAFDEAKRGRSSAPPPAGAPPFAGRLVGWLSRALAAVGPPPALAHHPAHINQEITHSSRFVLVDREADIRGYYHSDDKADLDRLRKDIRALLAG